ncbi:MAG: hypothetical protein ABGZ23_08360 [Fuerstiella sp.]
MLFLLQTWHILLAALCGMVNERQQQIIRFQNAQIEALLKKLGKKRLLLDDDQRRLLAVKAHAIGRKALLELTTIFTPDTILRWHRQLVAKKFDSSDKRQPGRPRIRQEVVDARCKRWGGHAAGVSPGGLLDRQRPSRCTAESRHRCHHTDRNSSGVTARSYELAIGAK